MKRAPSILARWRAFLVILMLAEGGLAAERLDDSASPRPLVSPQVTLSERGTPLRETLFPRTATVHYGWVEYRLDTSRYVGRAARIELVMPFVPGLRDPRSVVLQWSTRGRFAEGSLLPGERRMVWSGRVTEALMTELLDLRLIIDAAHLGELNRLSGNGVSPYFEIEAMP